LRRAGSHSAIEGRALLRLLAREAKLRASLARLLRFLRTIRSCQKGLTRRRTKKKRAAIQSQIPARGARKAFLHSIGSRVFQESDNQLLANNMQQALAMHFATC
jgi:hypothetical protein